MKQVIEDFIMTLSTRINLLNRSNDILDSSRVDEIENIIDRYGVLDTSRYNEKDIDYIADIVGIPPNDKIRSDYPTLDGIIESFIDEYNVARETHLNNRDNEVARYNKYIDLLSKDTLDEAFGDYDELENLMNELGVMISDKWKILAYINQKNVDINAAELELVNLNSKLVVYNNLYLDNESLNNDINNYINDINIDIDMIPNIAKKIADNKYNVDKTRNALATIILNELYKQLKEDNSESTHLMINNTLQYLDLYDEQIINPCKSIVLKYEDILNEEINKGNNINDYMNISINDIENSTNDHDKAVTLKELPIIKRIKETLDNMSTIDPQSDEYISYIKLLGELKEAYSQIQ
jgi:hypothetical protein